jgi:hypothetical protein
MASKTRYESSTYSFSKYYNPIFFLIMRTINSAFNSFRIKIPFFSLTFERIIATSEYASQIHVPLQSPVPPLQYDRILYTVGHIKVTIGLYVRHARQVIFHVFRLEKRISSGEAYLYTFFSVELNFPLVLASHIYKSCYPCIQKIKNRLVQLQQWVIQTVWPKIASLCAKTQCSRKRKHRLPCSCRKYKTIGSPNILRSKKSYSRKPK